MTLVYFVLILGITIFIHELGHFIFAKKAGVYVSEFSIGMGPKLKSFKRKNDETEYNLRLFPIGGFVAMAGETTDEVNSEIKPNRWLINKPWKDRFMVMVAGVMMNFIFAFIILIIIGSVIKPASRGSYVYKVEEGFEAYQYLKEDDKIIKVNNQTILSNEHLMLELMVNSKKPTKIMVQSNDNEYYTYTINAKKITDSETNEETYKFGISITSKEMTGPFQNIRYAVDKMLSLIHQMVLTIGYLITGKLSLNNLAGPVGIYNLVGETAKTGFLNILYLVGFLSINVGFVNLLPIPAFDGGHILFLIIEKLKGSKVDTKLENKIHNIGFILLMTLMLLITWNDIIRIFK